ncbi:MAG TPA: hypothetical protein PK195_03520 [Ignavibacteriaceae bacterium]|nr:MAG: hypothetical protein BWY38_02579 [Ignavibacteria bacterium ADurb.Bin266]HQI42123.1 hypothetical protein [Ignavibacteriaceae bacterium]HQJ45685.1 hypothetical protein [Ignavibacteriaceae bacterium]
MTMVTEGIEFIDAKVQQVVEYLENVDRKKIQVLPCNLKINNNGRYLFLSIMNGGIKDYLIRKSFLYKLFKWYSFPLNQLHRLSMDTITSVCNDYLMNIDREFVNIIIENDEALTITSPGYNEITDLDVIRNCAILGVRTVSRNDFMLRITTEEKYKFQPKPGDDCGIGINIINSETGFRTLSVSHFVLRYICSNGAIIKINNGGEKIHYGHCKNELQLFLQKQINLILANQHKIANSISNLTNKPASEFVESVNKKIESYLGKNEGKDFLAELKTDSSLYDLFNIVTEKAKKYDLSKKVLLESLAGDLIAN